MSDQPELTNLVDLSQRRSSPEEFSPLIMRDPGGRMQNILANAVCLFTTLPSLIGLVQWNDFTCQYEVSRSPPVPKEDGAPLAGPYPRALEDFDILCVVSYLQRRTLAKWQERTIRECMMLMGKHNRVHPLRDWLDANQSKWDGTPRLDQWLWRCFGAERSPLVEAFAARTLIAAVRRLRHPGTKHDHVLVLEGPQGLRKSTAISTLFGAAYFSDALPIDLGDKDAAMHLHGIWAVELGEIEKVTGMKSSATKAFLSRDTDRFRPPYGRAPVTVQRQTVFFGTTNHERYLTDSTGNRRYWPVACVHSDIEWLRENREQLWAEAAMREASGECHWLHEDELVEAATEAQAARLLQDPWHEKIEGFVADEMETKGAPCVTGAEILHMALAVPAHLQTPAMSMRIGAVLRALGLVRHRAAPRLGHARGYEYWPVGTHPSEQATPAGSVVSPG